jgi:hypothetical protein
MKGVLLVTVLSVSSSNARNEEVDVEDHPPDTIQWWIGEDEAWRIRTFGLDHDIHVYLVPDFTREAAEVNTRKHFWDIISRQAEVPIAHARDRSLVASSLKAAGLAPTYYANQRFVFWRPDDAEYSSQTRPKD